MSKRLPVDFYTRTDVVAIAKELLGKKLVTQGENGLRTSGIIVETEAYAGEVDRASHAYNGRRTSRTEIMYAGGGLAYVYLCYGIHHLFNVVVNREEVPHAVLVRAVEPLEGIEEMLRRSRKIKTDFSLTGGPGCLTRALGISVKDTGENLVTGTKIWIEEGDKRIPPRQIISSTRVGVAYAAADALLPYRFTIRDNPWVSKGKGL